MKTEQALAAARELTSLLARNALSVERERRLPAETVETIRRSGLFHLLRPGEGDEAAPFQTFLDVTRILAQACASTAWVYGNLGFHQWILALWPESVRCELDASGNTPLIASALTFPHGHAEAVEDGFRLTGHWKFSSGVQACDWIFLGGITSASDGELPEYRVFLVPLGRCKVVDTWHAVGLKGSGSHEVTASQILVPIEWTLSVNELHNGNTPHLIGSACRIAAFDLFPHVAASVALGIAQAAVQAFATETRHRVTSYTTTLMADHATTQVRLGEAAAATNTAELLIRNACALASEQNGSGLAAGDEQRVRLRRDAAYAARLCTHAVDILFEASGGRSLYDTEFLQRAFRDVHAVQSHYLLSWDVAAAAAGRSLLGISPELPPL